MKQQTIARYHLNCPRCHGALVSLNDELKCAQCKTAFPIRDDVPNFVGKYQFSEFYAEKFIYPLPWGLKERIFTLFHPSFVRYRFFAKYLSKNSTILDLGCGGGIAFLKQYGTVVGLELSHTAAKVARDVYDYTVVANSSQLPFENNSFDAIVSLDVLGHIPVDEKKQVIAEIMRVLKPGGRTLHFSEADGQNPWAEFAKRSPKLYQRYFIDQDGHYGIVTPKETAAFFSAFETMQIQPVYKFFTAAEEYVKRFNNEYKNKSRAVSVWVSICHGATLLMPTKVLMNTILNIVRSVTDQVLPYDWGDGILIACKKAINTHH